MQVGSFYSLLLPLWLHAFPCDQLLVLQHDAFFGTSPPPASASASSASTSSSSSTAAATVATAPSTRWVGPARPASSRPPALPPPRQELLRTTLRFLGLPLGNATALAQLQHFQPPPPDAGLASNPIDAALRRELSEFFAPFQEQLGKLLASHLKCFHERTSSKRKKRKTKVV